MWGGGSIKLQITVKTVVGVTEWNMGLKIQEKNVIGWKVKFVCIASDIRIELGYRMLRLEIQVWMLGREREKGWEFDDKKSVGTGTSNFSLKLGIFKHRQIWSVIRMVSK